MTIKLQLELLEPTTFWKDHFGKADVELGDEATLVGDAKLVNMSSGARNISPSDLVTFIIANYQSISTPILAAALFRIVSRSAKRAILNNNPVNSEAEIEEILHEQRADGQC